MGEDGVGFAYACEAAACLGVVGVVVWVVGFGELVKGPVERCVCVNTVLNMHAVLFSSGRVLEGNGEVYFLMSAGDASVFTFNVS